VGHEEDRAKVSPELCNDLQVGVYLGTGVFEAADVGDRLCELGTEEEARRYFLYPTTDTGSIMQLIIKAIELDRVKLAGIIL
jgi:hypothetical protein